MKTSLDAAIHLLHATAFGTLATQSTQLPGYPFASILPFVPDERQRPLFLVSGLAEHTKNLLADQRTSLLVASQDAPPQVLTAARMTLLGDATRVTASPELVARYLRYQPDAEQYLGLGDFNFFQLTPKRARYIAGFGQMGWIEQGEWTGAAVLPLADEAALMQELIGVQPPGVRLLGLDCYGFDMDHEGKRERQRFPGPATTAEKIGGSVRRLLAAL